MITIPLKPNNRPTQPGMYLVAWNNESNRESIERVYRVGRDLWVSHRFGQRMLMIVPESTLWSDELDIVYE